MASVAIRSPEILDSVDQRVLLRDVPWATYVALADARHESAVPRITYCQGRLELMSPSIHHERIKSNIGRILEAWALREGLDFDGFGSWTLRNEDSKRGLEPDECYMLGSLDKAVPDLAIEVAWTRGGMDKLEVYRGLGVGEVWTWMDGEIHVHVLVEGAYVRSSASRLLPGLDLGKLARCASLPRQTEAVRAFLC
jgi:Uma2 family endonuclease